MAKGTHWACSLVLLATPSFAPPSLAAVEPQPGAREREYRLDFQGAPGCDDPAALEYEVRNRVPEAVSSGEARSTFVVRVGSDDAGTHAQFVIQAPDGESERIIEGADCATVLRGIALMIAVYFDQQGSPTTSPPTEREPAPASHPPPIEPKQPPSPEELPAGRERRIRPFRRPANIPLRFGLIAGGETRTAASPVLLTAAQLGIEFGADQTDTWLAPSFRLTGSYGAGLDSTQAGAAWGFHLQLFRALACPAQYVSSRKVRWHACAVFEAGRLTSSGTVTLEGSTSQKLPWIGGGPAIALEFAPWRHLGFEVAASSVVLGKHGRFVEQTGPYAPLIHEVSWVSVGLSVSALTWVY